MEYLELKKQIEELISKKGDFEDSQNLLELGLNSLQIMRLINKWRSQGIKLSFGTLMESPTLGEWWKIIKEKKEESQLKTQEKSIGSSGENKNIHTQKLINEDPINSEPFELTDVQYAYWIGREADRTLGGIGCHAYLEFDGKDIDVERLEKAWNIVQNHHPMLRDKFISNGMQHFMKKPYSEFIQVYDLRDENDKTIIEKSLLKIREKLSHRKLKVEDGQVAGIKVTLLPDNKSRLHFDLDLLVADVQSLEIILRDLCSAYMNRKLPIDSKNWNFNSYLKYKKDDDIQYIKESEEYWIKRLEILPTGPELPLAKHPEEIKETKFTRRIVYLDNEEWQEIKNKAAINKTTPAMVLLAAYVYVLDFYSSTKQFLINVPIFNRNTEYYGIDNAVADFTSLLLLEADCRNKPTFLELLNRLERQFRKDMKYSRYSGVQVQRELSKLRGTQRNAAPIVFACNLGDPLVNEEFKNSIGTMTYMISQTPDVWIDFQSYEDKDGIMLSWDSVDELFPENLIQDMMKSFEKLLHEIISNGLDNTFDLMSDNQKQFIEEECNIGNIEEEKCIHESFLEYADKFPDSPAIVDSSTESIISYQMLKEKACTVASAIIKLGISKSPIAITFERGYEQIICAIGVLISGNYYVPISSEQPSERKKIIYEKTDIKYVVTQGKFADELKKDCDINVLVFEQLLNTELVDEYPEVSPKDSAYIIMTSGSTGLPKGVEISHYSAWNTIHDINKKYEISRKDSVLCLASMDFDLSVYDIFGILGSGGRLVIIPDEERRNSEYWLTQIQKYNITVWNSVPILLEMMLIAAKAKKIQDISLRVVFLSGDWIPMNLPDKLFELKNDIRLIAMGGATEASIWSNYFEVKPNNIPNNWKSIPYGRPLQGQVYRVIDEDGRDCPYWVKGELMIGGFGIAKGYRGDIEKTKEKFSTENNIRWYKTGDLGKIWPDGTIEFLGRKDFQVKLKGHRIELGEIESAIKQINNIKECVVSIVNKSTKVKLLCAAIVPEDVNEEIDISYIEDTLKDKLPRYMIPSHVFINKEVNITKNGKLDRSKLSRWIENKVKESNGNKALPVTKLESEILDIWKDVFNRLDIGAEDNYFEIGGDSLAATKIIAVIKEKYNIQVPLHYIFENYTVKALSKKITDLTEKEKNTQNVIMVKHDEQLRYKEFNTTEIQYAYWVGRQNIYSLGNVSSYCYYELECENIDLLRLNETWQEIIKVHDSLRLVFTKDGRKQYVLKEVPKYEFKINDCCNLSDEEKDRSIQRTRESMSQQVLDACKWPLFDVRITKQQNSKAIIHIGIDNMIMDARSVLQMLYQWSNLYNRADYKLEREQVTFADYIYSLEEFKNSEKYNLDKKYWIDRIETFPDAAMLPIGCKLDEIKNQTTIRLDKRIGKDEWQNIKEAAKKYNITPSAILISMYAMIISEYSNSMHFAINITLDKRMIVYPDMKNVYGDFTSTLLLEIKIHHGEDFILFAQKVQEQLLKDMAHISYSGVEFARELSRKGNNVNKQYSNLVVTSTIGLLNKNRSLFGDIKYNITQTPQVWMDYQIQEIDNELYINWDFVKELFDKNVIDEMFNKYYEYINMFIENNRFSILNECEYMEGTI